MSWRALVAIAIALVARPAAAHVGSPDVFYEGSAGPYPVFVAVRMPTVIPGIATIEIRARTQDVTAMSVVPMRLSGPGSEHPPTPDHAARSADDPQFFTASLWLMESGALKVRIDVDGARGRGQLAVPIPAVPTRATTMDATLGTVLFALMALLAIAIVSIAAAAARDATRPPGTEADARRRRRSRIAGAVAMVVVVGVCAFGNSWWNLEATAFRRMIARPWVLEPRLEGCRLTLPLDRVALLSDHGHDIHLILMREPGLDRLAHLHPTRDGDDYVQQLPSLPAGRYRLFADIVLASGFPITGTGTLDIATDLGCPTVTGDDATWSAVAPTAGASGIVFDRPTSLRAREPVMLKFRIVDAAGQPARDVEPYMAMAGHAFVVRADLGVFAHLHPSGTVAMPALMLAGSPHEMYAPTEAVPPELTFPFGFPTPGRYRVFVQIKRAGRIETGSFDLEIPALN